MEQDYEEYNPPVIVQHQTKRLQRDGKMWFFSPRSFEDGAKVWQFTCGGRQLSSLVETKEALALPLFSDEICHSDVLLYKQWTCDAGKDIFHDGAEDKVLVGNFQLGNWLKQTKGFLELHLSFSKWVILNCVARISLNCFNNNKNLTVHCYIRPLILPRCTFAFILHIRWLLCWTCWLSKYTSKRHETEFILSRHMETTQPTPRSIF